MTTYRMTESDKKAAPMHPMETMLRVPGESSGVNWRDV